jgi:sialate O-acetylesterase
LVNRSSAEFPQIRGEGKWQTCTPETVQPFSAVGYFFGKKIHADLNIPIGLVSASWGGTPAEVWTPDSLIMNNPVLKASAEKQSQHPWAPILPGIVYNSMIAPIVPFPIAGTIWYQGEANTVMPHTYKTLMETMIQSWRTAFNKQFPFYYVQIAPFTYGKPNEGTLIRDQQTKMLSIPNTGMVVVSDLVEDVKDIHPRFKKTVGERLANYALAETYGRTAIAYKSPLYKSMKIEKGKIIVAFDNCPNGLIVKGDQPTEFMIAGEDKIFLPATVKLNGNTVIVSSKEIKNPVAVRFGWANESMPNLFSKEGLPASCFRTDDW